MRFARPVSLLVLVLGVLLTACGRGGADPAPEGPRADNTASTNDVDHSSTRDLVAVVAARLARVPEVRGLRPGGTNPTAVSSSVARCPVADGQAVAAFLATFGSAEFDLDGDAKFTVFDDGSIALTCGGGGAINAQGTTVSVSLTPDSADEFVKNHARDPRYVVDSASFTVPGIKGSGYISIREYSSPPREASVLFGSGSVLVILDSQSPRSSAASLRDGAAAAIRDVLEAAAEMPLEE